MPNAPSTKSDPHALPRSTNAVAEIAAALANGDSNGHILPEIWQAVAKELGHLEAEVATRARQVDEQRRFIEKIIDYAAILPDVRTVKMAAFGKVGVGWRRTAPVPSMA